MAGTNAPETVVCCFCGEAIAEDAAARLVVYPPGAEGESQTLFCHSSCLTGRLYPGIPYHPGLDDEGPK